MKSAGYPIAINSAVAHIATVAPSGDLVYEAYYCEIGSACVHHTILHRDSTEWTKVVTESY